MNIDATGSRMPNGTWTDKLGQIQLRHVDTFAQEFGFLDRFDYFATTMPVHYSNVYALMLRPTSFSDIYTNNVFQSGVYLLIVAALLVLCVCAYLNEKRHLLQIDDNVNNIWQQLHCLIPFNATWWTHQNGVTRKVQIMTGSIGLLLLLTYYQCNLLHHLLVPKPPPIITLMDIAESVRSHKVKLQFYKNQSLYEKEIAISTIGEIAQLAAAMKVNQPLYRMDDRLSQVRSENAIIIDHIDRIYAELYEIEPDECAKFALVKIPLTSMMSMFILNKHRRDMVEVLNNNIAQRYGFLERVREEKQPDEICLRHILSDHPPVMSHVPLTLESLSASFVYLGFLLICAMMIFIVEILYSNSSTTLIARQQTPTQQLTMVINLAAYSPIERHVIIHNCATFIHGQQFLKDTTLLY